MVEVKELRKMSCLVTVQTLLDVREDSSPATCERLIKLLKTDSFTAVTSLILVQLLRHYSEKMTDEVLLSVVPPHMKRLKLDNCSQLTSSGIEQLLHRCRQLEEISFRGCKQLLRPTFFQLVGHISPHINSISLSSCSTVCDILVKNLLKSLPHLKNLCLAFCSSVTDDAFMLNKAVQLRSAAYSFKSENEKKARHKIKLECVDVSDCGNITSTGIRNLTSLCGSTLLQVNISNTKADCVSLLYLAGYSMYAALKVAMAADQAKNSNLRSQDLENSDVEDPNALVAQQDGRACAAVSNEADISSEAAKSAKTKAHFSGGITSAELHPGGTFKSDSVQSELHDVLWEDSNSKSNVEAFPLSQLGQFSAPSTSGNNENMDTRLSYTNGPCSCYRACADQKELHTSIRETIRIAHKLYDPQLQSLKIDGMDFHSADLGEVCLTQFFQRNTSLQTLSISWGDLSDTMLSFIAKHSPRLKSISLVDCDSLSTFGVTDMCMKCHDLRSVNLQGVCFFGDAAVLPLIVRGNVHCLNLAESNISDGILRKIASHCGNSLRELDLSWCEKIGWEDDQAVTDMVSNCNSLERLSFRHCQITEATVVSLSDQCRQLRFLELSSVSCLTDSLLVTMSMRLRELRQLFVGWNNAVTDLGATTILTHCPQLQDVYFSGNKQITADPFLPLITNVQQWRRSQALLRLKLHEQKTLDEHLSSDEEFEELYMPHRSTVYATRLKFLDVEHCEKVNKTHLAEIVAVCRGSLLVRDFYGHLVEPKWVVCRQGQVFVA